MRIIIRLKRKAKSEALSLNGPMAWLPAAAGVPFGPPVGASLGDGAGSLAAPVVERARLGSPTGLTTSPSPTVDVELPVQTQAVPGPLGRVESSLPEAVLEPPAATRVDSFPPLEEPVRAETSIRPKTGLRCTRCGSHDVWRFGRINSWQAAYAGLCRGQWVTCRKCGKRFVTDHYGPMRTDF